MQDELEQAPKPLFVLGLPKSGTTLLQRLLATHSGIVSTEEPWLLLPMVYALRENASYTEYGARSCRISLETMCESLPEGRKDYWRACRAMAQTIHLKLAKPRTIYVLDKTPRYHLIVDELEEIFPDAKYLLMLRNPLAVIGSVIEHNQGRISGLVYGALDVQAGYSNLQKAMNRFGGSVHVISYEDFVSAPVQHLDGIMEFLGLYREAAQMADFQATIFLRGDRNGDIYDSISTASLEKWRQTLASPARKSLALRLLNSIEPKVLAEQGYDKDELRAELATLHVRWGLTALAEYLYWGLASARMTLQSTVLGHRGGRRFFY